jgi:hypothetical protein
VTTSLPDPILVALRVAEALEACGVRYTVGGSVASSVSGEPRSTLDVDIVVAMSDVDVDPFIDEAYLRRGAAVLGVADLLLRAQHDAS